MARTLDFNSLSQPTLDVTMRDESHTVLRLTIPTENHVERLRAAAAELGEIIRDENGRRRLYELAGELFSCNTDMLPVTGEELSPSGKYRLSLTDLVAFLNAYLAFITEIRSAKN